MRPKIMTAAEFNGLKARIPALDELPDAREGEPANFLWVEYQHAVLDMIEQHNHPRSRK